VSFLYSAALPNDELEASPPADLVLGGSGELHCTTCHDPHDDAYGMFLAKDNQYSALCISCHQITGWNASAHATSTASVVGILPRPSKISPSAPTWTQLGQWGCETCHTPHFAPTPAQLLNFTEDPPNPFSCTSAGCHSSDPPPAHGLTAQAVAIPGRADPGSPGTHVNIAGQTRKISAHRDDTGTTPAALRRAGRAARSGISSIGCVDCHNPHLARRTGARAPYASGMLNGVSGVDRNGLEIRTATYEYEVCFKCHSDATPDLAAVVRVVSTTNTRLEFDPGNPSYHPVVEMGKSLNVPSIPSSLEPGLRSSDVIYCTSCHADDEGGSRGPHGSSFAPILRARYDTADGTPESQESYALCYRCHERSSILGDASFRKKTGSGPGGGHSGHLAAGAPCSACHDPHGVSGEGAAGTGSHTHLVNFDRTIVQPRAGSRYPLFDDRGSFSGNCTLVCHGVVHDGLSYP
jgi:predicted CXXCH cytochrome family protein